MTLPTRSSLEKELRRRATGLVGAADLRVDYYRVRRKVAYPLPIRGIELPGFELRGFRDYPWAIWMAWALEERVNALGWAGHFLGDEDFRSAARADLEALAAWPTYRQYEGPDLSAGHALRTLSSAFGHWDWLEGALRSAIADACRRAVDDLVPRVTAAFAGIDDPEAILRVPEPHRILHNIPLIGTLGAALAARVCRHPESSRIDGLLEVLIRALLDLRGRGGSEAVAYDGYVLDFVADWLSGIEAPIRARLMDHPAFGWTFDESIFLSVPGELVDVAELSDVEPVDMPFHLSAHAKCHLLRPGPGTRWYLRRCRPARLRSDGLAALIAGMDDGPEEAPPAGILDAHYARVLRTGYSRTDLAVAMAASTSPMGHVHCDGGSIVIGTDGSWLVTDPGYQQYLDTSERRFTMGPSAHNAPVVNGHAQGLKAAAVVTGVTRPDGELSLTVGMTGCYPPEARLDRVERTVRLLPLQGLVLVTDRVEGRDQENAYYSWHGHAEAAWWLEAGWAKIAVGRSWVWVGCREAVLTGPDIRRLAGSRGQLSLIKNLGSGGGSYCWVFRLNGARPEFRGSGPDRTLIVDGRAFPLESAPG